MSDSVFDLMEQMGHDAGVGDSSVSAPSDDKLYRVRNLAQQQLTLERRIARGEELLKQLNAELQELRTKTLPDAMKEIGLPYFEMADGSVVEYKKHYFASIPSESTIEDAKSEEEREQLRRRRDQAMSWLRSNGHGSLIKNMFRVNFGKGEDAKAAALLKTLLSKRFAGVEYTRSEGVHPSTLKAFVKEQIEKGKPLAADLLGASAVDVSKVTPKKEKK